MNEVLKRAGLVDRHDYRQRTAVVFKILIE